MVNFIKYLDEAKKMNIKSKEDFIMWKRKVSDLLNAFDLDYSEFDKRNVYNELNKLFDELEYFENFITKNIKAKANQKGKDAKPGFTNY